MRKLAFCFALVMLAALIPGASLAATPRGYETPEACAEALYSALLAQDAGALEACLAFHELAAQFDFQAYAERMKAIVGISSYLPADNPYGVAYNEALLRRMWYIRLSAFTMEAADPVLAGLFGGISCISGSEEYDALLEAVEQHGDTNVFSLLTYAGTIRPDAFPAISERFYSEKSLANLKANLACWNIDTYEELAIAVASAADDTVRFIIPIRFLEIEGRWLADPNLSVLGMLLGMDAFDFVIPMP